MSRDRYLTTIVHGRTFEIIVAGDDKHDWRLANPEEQPEYDRLRRLDVIDLYRDALRDSRWHTTQATIARLDAEHYPKRRTDFEDHIRRASIKRRMALGTARAWQFTAEEIAIVNHEIGAAA